jgi:hypothetical protein
LNDIGQAFFDEVTRASAQYAERGGDPYAGFATPGGSRDVFIGDTRPMELGSDHEVFQSSGWGVPMLYFHDWPDTAIHTNKDQPENLDATKLGRVTYLGAGIAYTLAALPDTEAARLLTMARYEGEQELAQARKRMALGEHPRDGALAVREALAMQRAKLQTVSQRWPATAAATKALTEQLKTQGVSLPAPATNDARVPVPSPTIRGPLNVYYYDHFNATLAERNLSETSLPAMPELTEGDADLVLYEALNLADGKRSITEIRDIITGRYVAVPQALIAAHFERLERAGIISWR